MNTFNDIVSDLKGTLAGTSVLSNVKFIMDFPFVPYPNPINKIYAAMGISKIVITDGSFSGYLGLNSSGEVYGRLADIKIRIKIYSPQSLEGKSCHEVFSKIYETLLASDTELSVQSVTCDEIKYDSNTSTFTLDIYVNISTFVGYETMSTDIEDILLVKSE